MGIDLYCDKQYFYSSYSIWNLIRTTILSATLHYLRDELKQYIKDNSNDQFQNNNIIKNLNEMIDFNDEYLLVNKELSINLFLSSIVNLDDLIQFDIYGIYALCNKSDCEGFYSPGNSLDICILLDIIKPYIKDSDIYTKLFLSENSLYKLFEESFTKKIKITIS